MQFWMGPRYANGLLPAILAIGYLAVMAQTPVLKILAGLNAHGRAGIAQLIASICSTGLTLMALGYLKLDIVGAVIAITLPLTMINIFYLPFLVCRRVNLDIKKYFFSVTTGPVVHILPFGICLVIARTFFHNEPLIGLTWGGSVGSVILMVLYWQYVLPKSLCTKLKVMIKALIKGEVVRDI